MEFHCDGFTIQKNPSPLGGGYAVVKQDGTLLKYVTIKKQNFTNNEGELLGIVSAALLASQNDTIVTDSKNSIIWIRKRSGKRKDLVWAMKLANKIIESKHLNLIWRPREVNLAGHYNEDMTRFNALHR